MFTWLLFGCRTESVHGCHRKVSTRQHRNEPLHMSLHFFFFFLYETISIYKTEFQETKALFGVIESVEYETLQGCIPSHGNVSKVKKMRYDDQWNTFLLTSVCYSIYKSYNRPSVLLSLQMNVSELQTSGVYMNHFPVQATFVFFLMKDITVY